MSLRNALTVSMGFVLGAVAAVVGLHWISNRPVTYPEAQRRALQALDRPATQADIGDNRIVGAVKKIEPAVVNIDVVGPAPSSGSNTGLNSLFGNQEVRGKGSGVIITSDGYIVTNNHVIEDARKIRVTLPAGSWYYAKLIGFDAKTDLAVLHVDAANLPYAELGDSDRLQVGEWSIAVGNPLGLGSTTTVGVISALNRRNLMVDEGRDIDGAIQTDAAINRGNSGGALANINGQLIGINTAILSSAPGGGNIGLGFALPVNTVRRVARDIISDGHSHEPSPHRPWLGIQYQPLSSSERSSLQLSDDAVKVRRALPGGPAQAAGIKAGDILLSIDGKPIGDERDVVEAVQQTGVGNKCKIHLLRPETKSELNIVVIIGERPARYQ